MTWGEIKQQIEAGGVTDEMQLWYIDISFEGELTVIPETTIPEGCGFTVSN